MPRLLSRLACRDFRLVLALAALALALAAPARAANPNLAPNPGFEQPCPGASCGWGTFELTVSSTDTARSGARAALLQGTSINSALVTVGCVPIAPSTTYAFSVWARPAGATPVEVGLMVTDGCPGGSTRLVTTSVPAGRWTRVTVTIPTGGAATAATLFILAGGGVIVDDAVFGVAAGPSIAASAFQGGGVEGQPYTPGAWTASAVTLHYTCAPGIDGLGVDCPADDEITSTTDEQRTATTTQEDGSTATATTHVRVDRTAPVLDLAYTRNGQPYTPGTWATGAVDVQVTCSDAHSGVNEITCPAGTTIGDEGTTSYDVSVMDRVGNETLVTLGPVRVDPTPPTLLAHATQPGGAPYTPGTWTPGPVTLAWECGDDTSGLAGACPATTTYSADGITPSVDASLGDVAGNRTDTGFGPIRIDATPPQVVIDAPVDGSRVAPGATLTARYTCADQRSGLAGCDGSVADGAALDTGTVGEHVLTVTGTDVAGNIAIRTARYVVGTPPLTLRARDVTVAYGQPIPTLGVTGDGFVLDDDLASLAGTLTCTATGAAAVPAPGSYPIRCSGLTSPHYAITYSDATLTVEAPASGTLTLPGRGTRAVTRTTTTLPVACAIARPGLGACTVQLRRGSTVLATATATQPAPGSGPLTVTLPVDARLRRLARRPDGLVATLIASATQAGHAAPLATSAPLILTPTRTIPVRTDGRLRGTALHPDAALRALRDALAGTTAIRCTGHTDSRGPAAKNRQRARTRAAALCAYLAAGTSIRTTVASKGETRPRRSNRTAAGRAANRRIEVIPTYPA